MYFEIICMKTRPRRRLPWSYIHPCDAVRICVYYFSSLFLLWPDLTSTEQFTYCLISHLDPSNLSFAWLMHNY